jgi:predicted DNA-binding transcriptional regulator AlpA
MKSDEEERDHFLTTEEAASLLQLSPRTLIDKRYKGTGPEYYKFSSAVRYKREDLLAWGKKRKSTSEKDEEVSG